MHHDTMKPIDCRFASLGSAPRVFVIPSIHGQLHQLNKVHEHIFQSFRPGDRLVYLGNYTGYGAHSRECINAILSFRRFIMSMPGVQASDIAYLRGAQEELWQKLIQLQFAPQPATILEWMLDNGLAQTMESYGLCLFEAQRVVREGIIRLSRWTEKVRHAVYNNAGHDIFGAQLKRAAFTSCPMTTTNGVCSPLLFVNAGVDFTKPLEEQGDSFWWGHPHFSAMRTPYSPYQKVIRGYDPRGGGYDETPYTMTLDDNAGRGGKLLLAEMAFDGDIKNLIAA